MKKKFKCFFACTAILAVGLTGCTKEDIIKIDDGKGSDVVEGVSTYATFNFVIDRAGTRATDMINDKDENAEVKDIRLIIFKTGAVTTCEVNDVYKVGETDWESNKSKTVQLTSGTKRIFVITNAESQKNLVKFIDTTSVVVGKTSLGEFYNMAYDLGAAKLANIDKLKELVDPVNRFVLSNTISSKSSFTLRGGVGMDESRKGSVQENNFNIEIQRTVAKAAVYYKSTALETTDKAGKLSDLKYTMQNVNRSLYLFQKFASDMVDPAASTPRSPYYSLALGTPAATYDTTYYSDYKFVSMSDKVNGNVYITENTSETPRIGTTTYAAIQSVFLPKSGHVVDTFVFDKLNSKFTATASKNDASTAKTLYKLVDVGTSTGLTVNAFFVDSVLAYKAAYCIDKKTDVGFDIKSIDALKWDSSKGKGYIIEYPGGISYHRLNIGSGNVPNFVPGVKRNNIYNAQITSFSGIGAPNLKDLNKDLENTIGQKTHVTATISVINWSTVNTENQL
ncbi:MAG: Mfa1 family fimbria major subunit [Tannerellaceae bacterium]|jgi:hypothetical protein|nr:Mfa1 family fimbria major subunit [Tannerellaceae bacterium]